MPLRMTTRMQITVVLINNEREPMVKNHIENKTGGKLIQQAGTPPNSMNHFK